MSILKYLITLAVALVVVAILSTSIISWMGIDVITIAHVAIVFGVFGLLGLLSIALMKGMGVTTQPQFMRYMMLNKTMRILLSLLMLIGFACFIDRRAVLPIAILVFVGYLTSIFVEGWYHLKLNQSK